MILVANIFKKSLLFFLFFLGACSSNNEILSISGQAFGTFYDIKFEESNHNLKRVNDEINNIFVSINQCCSTYKNDSLVSFKRENKNTDLFNQEIKNYFQEVVKISVKANKTVEGFILFNNIPTIRTFIGVSIIIGAGVYIYFREKVKDQMIITDTPNR